ILNPTPPHFFHLSLHDALPISLTWLMAKAGDNVLATDLSQIFNLWDQLTVKTESFFDQYDALVLPVAEGPAPKQGQLDANADVLDRKSTRLNSSHVSISYAVFC